MGELMAGSERLTDADLFAGAVRRAVVAGGRRLLEEGLVIGTTGNVSGRVSGRVWITPTRAAYDQLDPSQVSEVDFSSGTTLAGGPPSRELPLHLEVYRRRPDVRAVVHTHSVYATAWSFLGRRLEPTIEDLAYYGVGEVPTTRGIAPPGSAALAAAAGSALADANAALLRGHGVVSVADTVDLAVTRAAIVEHAARIAWLLRDETLETSG
jgi:L-fuculose-phosphate aldolase